MTYILDACALIAFINEETGKGFEAVDALIDRAIAGEITLCISVVNLVEVYYHYIKKDGERTAEKVMNEVEKLHLKVVDSASCLVTYIAPRHKASYPI